MYVFSFNMELKFDDLEMDKNFAQDYLGKHKEFRSFGFLDNILPSSGSWTVNNNKIMYSTMEDLKTMFKDLFKNSQNNDLDTTEARIMKFNQLALKITENKQLFAQLEYMIRGVPIEDSYSQLDLIVKQLRCQNRIFDYNVLAVTDDSPLLGLGCVVNLHSLNNGNPIFTTRDTAIIAHLFIELCHEVGLTNIYLVITNEECIKHIEGLYAVLNFKKVKDQISGTVGVITQHSDVDSAIDMFIESTTYNPWKLRNILVQESVYQHFKNTLKWKSNLKNICTSRNSPTQDSAPTGILESAIISYKNKVFLLDHIDPKSNSQKISEITIEAYRTTKELLSILENIKPFYLSLWTNDIVESNEIAYSVKSPVVWINNYSDFRGPDEICSFVYNAFKVTRCVKKTQDIAELHKVSESWARLSFVQRIKILFEVIDR